MSDVFIAGHSLGAAEACIYAFSRARRGLPVIGVYVFGCPRPGDHTLGAAVASAPVWRSIRNAKPSPAFFLDHDLITDDPPDMPLLDDRYSQMAPFEDCHAPPAGGDPWGPFAWHHIQLYQQGCRALPPTGPGTGVELVEAVDAVADLYNNAGRWDFEHFIDGQYWGGRIMPSGAKLLIARGSVTELDWRHDFESITQTDFLGARVSTGFLAGVVPAGRALDAWLAPP